jgi:solute:Na+ symporter, SSS family
MLKNLNTIDLIVLISLLGLMIISAIRIGLRKKDTSSFFMAGHSLRWWSVAGSIYGTNVSLSQIIGMLGIGYSIGFAQSHYEVLAIPAILLLCYVFIPIYRKKAIFTLSAFLEERYNSNARLLYAIIILTIILILLVGGLYIGSRQLGLLFAGSFFSLSYLQGIILIACVACALVFFGGMESVVIAENIITVLMVVAIITVGYFTLSQPEIGGITGLIRLDAAQKVTDQKMHLYLPSNHPDLPWTGVVSGLLILHSFFWTTNQFEVQRVLAAKTNKDAVLGAIAAGFLKLSIPFFSIAAGIAAAYLFKNKYQLMDIKPDDAFLFLLQKVIPANYGIMGLILAGFTAAIFSSIYSMLNAGSTIFSIDIYQQYIHKKATDQQLMWAGKLTVVMLCMIGAIMAYYSFDPRGTGNFFLTLSKNTSYLKPGIVSAFMLGVCWPKTNRKSAVVVILLSPFIGLLLEHSYSIMANHYTNIASIFGTQLNFMHRVFISFIICMLIQISMSLRKSKKPLMDTSTTYVNILPLFKWIGLVLAIPFLMFMLRYMKLLPLNICALIAAVVTFSVFVYKWHLRKPYNDEKLIASDLLYAGLLAAASCWILFYFA